MVHVVARRVSQGGCTGWWSTGVVNGCGQWCTVVYSGVQWFTGAVQWFTGAVQWLPVQYSGYPYPYPYSGYPHPYPHTRYTTQYHLTRYTTPLPRYHYPAPVPITRVHHHCTAGTGATRACHTVSFKEMSGKAGLTKPVSVHIRASLTCLVESCLSGLLSTLGQGLIIHGS